MGSQPPMWTQQRWWETARSFHIVMSFHRIFSVMLSWKHRIHNWWIVLDIIWTALSLSHRSGETYSFSYRFLFVFAELFIFVDLVTDKSVQKPVTELIMTEFEKRKMRTYISHHMSEADTFLRLEKSLHFQTHTESCTVACDSCCTCFTNQQLVYTSTHNDFLWDPSLYPPQQ